MFNLFTSFIAIVVILHIYNVVKYECILHNTTTSKVLCMGMKMYIHVFHYIHYQQELLVPSGTSLQFNYTREDFPQVSDVSGTLRNIHSLPEFLDSIY